MVKNIDLPYSTQRGPKLLSSNGNVEVPSDPHAKLHLLQPLPVDCAVIYCCLIGFLLGEEGAGVLWIR